VSGLRGRRDTKQLAEYAPTLARQTRTADDFDVAIKSLFQDDRMAEVIALAADLPELFALDDEYAALKGWALFRLGRVLEARTIARELMQRRGATNDRELAINTAIESGDWGNLGSGPINFLAG
jgi:Flp pilus assembly protein TadD